MRKGEKSKATKENIKLLTRPKKVGTDNPVNEAHNPKSMRQLDPMIAHLCQLSLSLNQLRMS